MAIGNNKGNLDTIYVKMIGFKKTDKKIYLSFLRKDGEEYVEFTQNNSVSGCVVDFQKKEFEFEGKKKKAYKIVLVDDTAGDKGERYVLEVSESNHGRNILNSILSMQEFLSPISISVYFKKSKKDGKDYPSVSVRYVDGDAFVPWKIPFAEINDMVTTSTNEDGEKIRNYKKVNAFFEKEVDKFIADNFKSKPKATASEQKPEPKYVEQEEKDDDPGPAPETTEEDDNLPF